jgi:hypothetical protein
MNTRQAFVGYSTSIWFVRIEPVTRLHPGTTYHVCANADLLCYVYPNHRQNGDLHAPDD